MPAPLTGTDEAIGGRRPAEPRRIIPSGRIVFAELSVFLVVTGGMTAPTGIPLAGVGVALAAVLVTPAMRAWAVGFATRDRIPHPSRTGRTDHLHRTDHPCGADRTTRPSRTGRIGAATARHGSPSPRIVPLGTDRTGAVAGLALFGPRPVRLCLVGPFPLAELVVRRCAALGVTVIVRTSRPRRWSPVVAHGGTVTLVPPAEVLPPLPANQPCLILSDLDPDRTPAGAGTTVTRGCPVPAALLAADPPPRPFCCAASVQENPDPAALRRADTVVLHRVHAGAAETVSSVLGFAGSRAWLAGAPADFAAVVRDGALRWVRLADPAAGGSRTDR